VWQAADCYEAVDLYRTHHKSIGVVLLDVRMPGRDGPSTLAALQEFDPHVRVCFMTGDAGRYTERDLLDLGALVVYRKPPHMSELAEQLAGIANPQIVTAKRTIPPT
jgi:DNA-binding NarL/FixJ family response regulator